MFGYGSPRFLIFRCYILLGTQRNVCATFNITSQEFGKNQKCWWILFQVPQSRVQVQVASWPNIEGWICHPFYNVSPLIITESNTLQYEIIDHERPLKINAYWILHFLSYMLNFYQILHGRRLFFLGGLFHTYECALRLSNVLNSLYGIDILLFLDLSCSIVTNILVSSALILFFIGVNRLQTETFYSTFQ